MKLDQKIRDFINKYEIDPLVAEALGSYVYMLADRNGSPFYVGKGTGRRLLQHFEEALIKIPGESEKIDKIISAFSDGEPKIKILRYGLNSDQEALLVEQVAIDLLGINNLANIVQGHHAEESGIRYLDDFINEKKSRPLLRHELPFPVLAVKINKYWNDRDWRNSRNENSLYDATRRAWKCSKNRLLFNDGSLKLRYVLAISDEIIREVYKVSSWHKDEVENNRWRFEGSPLKDDAYMFLKGKNISDLIRFGSGQSIAYYDPETLRS